MATAIAAPASRPCTIHALALLEEVDEEDSDEDAEQIDIGFISSFLYSHSLAMYVCVLRTWVTNNKQGQELLYDELALTDQVRDHFQYQKQKKV